MFVLNLVQIVTKQNLMPSPTGYGWISRLAPLTCVQLVFVWVDTQSADKPQFDAQARRVSDGYHASRPSPMFSLYVRTKFLSNCYKTQFDAQARRVTDGFHASRP